LANTCARNRPLDRMEGRDPLERGR
jgi:hypothetical protein